MMGRKRYTVTAAFLLFAVCCDVIQTCAPSWELECFKPADHMDASDPVVLKLSGGKKLNFFLEGLSNCSTYQWRRETGQLMEINENVSTVIQQLSWADSGRYTLSCKNQTGTNFSKTVDLHVAECPSKPQLSLDKMNEKGSSPFLKCIAKGSPRPKIQWVSLKKTEISKVEKNPDAWTAEGSVSSARYFDCGAMCCATNDEGQECTQLYDFELNTKTAKQDEVSNVIVSPGEPLLLRCRNQPRSQIIWKHGGKVLVDKDDEICIKEDSHYSYSMAYVFIRSVSLRHNGTYTCSNSNPEVKSVDIHVSAESFLSSQLPKQFVITHNNSCLEASISYHPVLELCYWEAPDGSVTKCSMDSWVAKHRTLKYCNPLQTGVYTLHLAAGGKTVSKSTTVCVVGKLTHKFIDENSKLVVQIVTTLPANSTWMSSPFSNTSSDTESSWKVIKTENHNASNDFCNETLTSFVSKDMVARSTLKFCFNNQVWPDKPWCNEYYLYEKPQIQPFRADPPSDGSVLPLKIGIMALLLALVLVSVLLMYYIKKKKPKYQPQLQMIQMVGPNDNDYIYINFKDFDYDKKWEFPREYLELGKELGSGAFGRVVQAMAYGINQPGVSQQVAVKMLQEKHHSVEKEALMSELKMLTHIGQHDNIVNLLGACTETGPIYLIFQYCCYGDLLNYLKKSGDRFHKSVTDAFNKDRLSSLYLNLQPKKNSSEPITAVDNYMPMQGSTTRGQEEIALITLSSNEMEGIYETEEDQTELQALTFDDLLSFAFQVAKGMEFLSSKNCIHRDLAARNVLVTKGGQVKIGDFGLARDIDNDSNYVVRGNVRLPVKWMAPESIFQGMYTMNSDVWAYGILLWEIFSLGVTPYPGIKVDRTFYTMIERGFKMECPYYANDSVYDIMCKCWALNPNSRPSFSKLADFMSDQLRAREERLYESILDQNSSDYQNTPINVEVSALVKESESKTAAAYDYCKANLR